MAYANDPSGGRTGPYWRRQMGITLPGERTAAELAQINALRAKQGLPAEGGPIGDNTRFISQSPQFAQRARLAHPASNLRDILQQVLLRRVQQAAPENLPPTGDKTFGQGIDELNYSGGTDALRQMLLSRFQNQIAPAPNYNRNALQRFAAQHQAMRQAQVGGGPRQTILPQRVARKALPY